MTTIEMCQLCSNTVRKQPKTLMVEKTQHKSLDVWICPTCDKGTPNLDTSAQG